MASENVVADQSVGAGPLPSAAPKPAPPRPGALSSPGALARADAFLVHLHRCLQTPRGIDTVLQMVWASSCLATALLNKYAPSRSPREVLSLLLLQQPASPAKGRSVAAVPLVQRIKALVGLTADARAFMRLWGLLAMYLGWRRLVSALTASKKPAVEKATAPAAADDEKPAWLSTTQLLATTVFQAADNNSVLARHGVIGWSPAQQGAIARLGLRAWSVFLGTEIGRLAFELFGREGPAATTTAQKEAVVRTQKALVRNLAWAPIIFSGAAGGGWISEMTSAQLAMIPSVVMMRDLWRETE